MTPYRVAAEIAPEPPLRRRRREPDDDLDALEPLELAVEGHLSDADASRVEGVTSAKLWALAAGVVIGSLGCLALLGGFLFLFRSR